jgi:hypothetical protein
VPRGVAMPNHAMSDVFRVRARDPLLFLHMPKTAGTSMRTYLARQYAIGDILPAANWGDVARGGFDPAAYRLCAGHFSYNFRPLCAPGTKTLTLLRDPVERYLSHFRHARIDPAFDGHHESLRSLNISQVIRDEERAWQWANLQCRWLARSADHRRVVALLHDDPHADPAILETANSHEALVERACEHLDSIDFVGVVEDLDMVSDELVEALGFHPSRPFPIENVAQADWTMETVTSEDREIIRGLNRLDNTLYDYALNSGRRRRRGRIVTALARRGTYNIPQLPFTIDVAGAMPGEGWGPAEHDGGTTWRWTGTDTPATLQLVSNFPPHSSCTISYFEWGLLAPPGFDVRVNGAPREIEVTHKDTHAELGFEICGAGHRGIDYLDLAISATGVRRGPLPSGERRPLGVPVFRISFSR